MNPLQRAAALSDLDLFQRALEERFAYLRTHPVEYQDLLDDLRERLPEQVDTGWFGLELQKVLAHFQDAHALVNARPPAGFLPFLVECVGDRLVALNADRSSLLDPQRPYLAAIDGVDAARWLRAAEVYAARGSPQFVRREALGWLRALRLLRADLGLPPRDEDEVALVGGANEPSVVKQLKVAERAALTTYIAEFEPEWQPQTDEFSEWHAMVVSPIAAPDVAFVDDVDPVRYLDRPVVVLMDARCFSATDVFLSALKGLPNVTLVGEPSGGGSARAQVVELPASGLKVRLASMASFQPTGELFDGHGVQPDVLVRPRPEFFVGGQDAVLERGLEILRRRSEVHSRGHAC